jgi:hypothetical protein
MKRILYRLARLLLRMATPSDLAGVLPEVFEQVDARVPKLLEQKVPPMVVESVLSSAVHTTLGRPATSLDVAVIGMLSDPIAAAANRALSGK